MLIWGDRLFIRSLSNILWSGFTILSCLLCFMLMSLNGLHIHAIRWTYIHMPALLSVLTRIHTHIYCGLRLMTWSRPIYIYICIWSCSSSWPHAHPYEHANANASLLWPKCIYTCTREPKAAHWSLIHVGLLNFFLSIIHVCFIARS